MDGIVLQPGMIQAVGGVLPNDWVTSTPTVSTQNNFSGWVGCRLEVGASDINITHLGRWIVSGNTDIHEIAIWDAAGTQKLASANIDTTEHSAGTFGFATCSYTLLANTQYRIGSKEVSGGDFWHSRQFYSTSAAASLVAPVFGVSNMTSQAGNNPEIFGPVNFRY